MPKHYELTLRVLEDGLYKHILEYKSEKDLVEMFGNFPFDVSAAFNEMVGTLRELVAKDAVGSEVDRAIRAMQEAFKRNVPPSPLSPIPAAVYDAQPTDPETGESKPTPPPPELEIPL